MQLTPNTTFPLHDLLAWWYGKWRRASSSEPPTWRDLDTNLPSYLLPHIVVTEAKTDRAAFRYRYVGEVFGARLDTDLTGNRVDELFSGGHLALIMSLDCAARISGRPVLSLSNPRKDREDAVAAAVPPLWRLFLPLRLLKGNRRGLVIEAVAFDDSDRSAEEREALAIVHPVNAIDEVSRETLPALSPKRLRAEVVRCRRVTRYAQPSTLASLLENTALHCEAQAARLDQLLRNQQ